jgi:NADPH:quinone reductase-like Zn-dependent oxidoreductase
MSDIYRTVALTRRGGPEVLQVVNLPLDPQGAGQVLIHVNAAGVGAAAVIRNCLTAWQMIHRVAKVGAGKTALVTAAAGGVRIAALQLLRLTGVRTYGSALSSKQELLRSPGATPVDLRAKAVDKLFRALGPDGIDYACDGVGLGFGANVSRPRLTLKDNWDGNPDRIPPVFSTIASVNRGDTVYPPNPKRRLGFVPRPV